jgi:FtsZ-interacting cell division protein YlmF
MIKEFLSRFFNFKNKKDDSLYTEGESSDNAKETKKIKPQKSKTMKKAKPNLPASSMLQAPASSGKAVVKKAVAKKVAKAVMKKAAKKKY